MAFHAPNASRYGILRTANPSGFTPPNSNYYTNRAKRDAANGNSSDTGNQAGGSSILTGLPAVDSLIKSLTLQVSQAGNYARKNLLQQKRASKQQAKQNKAELSAYQAQLAAMNVQPAPGVSSLSSPEVMQAQRQVAVDAANRKGIRKSILAGNAGGTVPTPARMPILA